MHFRRHFRAGRDRTAMVMFATLAAGLALAAAACGGGDEEAAPAEPVATEPAAPAEPAPAEPAPAETSAPTAEDLIASAGQVDDTSFCGDKPITLGIHDGYGINTWSAYAMAAVRLEAAKCPNVEVITAVGQGDLQKSISDINSFVTQGADAIVLIPDFGEAQLASIKAATAAGVAVVPWAADPAGTPGTDYVSYVDWDPKAAGKAYAEWMVEALGGQGNVIYLGGPAGNPVGLGMLAGMKEVFPNYPGITMLEGYDSWTPANWDAATAAKVATAHLAKYPQIDGIISEATAELVATLRVFEQAGRPLPKFTGLDQNQVGCAYEQYKPDNSGLEIATMSSRNWMGRIAARKAIAAAQGLENSEPAIFELPLYEDSLAGNPPECDATGAPETIFSNQVSDADLEQYGTLG